MISLPVCGWRDCWHGPLSVQQLSRRGAQCRAGSATALAQGCVPMPVVCSRAPTSPPRPGAGTATPALMHLWVLGEAAPPSSMGCGPASAPGKPRPQGLALPWLLCQYCDLKTAFLSGSHSAHLRVLDSRALAQPIQPPLPSNLGVSMPPTHSGALEGSGDENPGPAGILEGPRPDHQPWWLWVGFD